MSLDISLIVEVPIENTHSGIFIRENGSIKEISIEEWNRRNPGREPVVAVGQPETNEVFEANITHNLGQMAEAAGIYYACWRPEEIGIKTSGELIPLLEKGLADLKARPEYFETFSSSNGWGKYKDFVPWVERYLNACKEFPAAKILVWR